MTYLCSMQFQSRSAVIVVSDIRILQQDRSFNVQSLGYDAWVVGWKSSKLGESSEGFFVALLKEQPPRCIGVENHSNAKDECRQDLESEWDSPSCCGLTRAPVWSHIGVGIEGWRGGRSACVRDAW